MFESNIVRFIIIPIYAGMALFTIFLIGKNSASSDSLKNGGILIASLLPVLIAVLPYINLQEDNENLVFNLIYDSKTKQVIDGNYPNPYTSAYASVFCNVPNKFLKVENPDDLMGKTGLDLIEKGIINETMLNFSSHWDFEIKKQTTPSVEIIQRLHSNEEFKQLNLEDVKKTFPHNAIIRTAGVLVGNGLAIPPNSNLLASETERERNITIANKKIKLTIQIIPSMLSVAQKGLEGIIEPDPTNMNRYYIISYEIRLNLKINRFEQFSPEIKKYKKWFKNTTEILKKFTWDEIAEKNKRQLLNKAIKTILDTKPRTSTTDIIDNNSQSWKQVNIP